MTYKSSEVPNYFTVLRVILYISVVAILPGCGDSPSQANESLGNGAVATTQPLPLPRISPVVEVADEASEQTSTNSRYFFNVKGHSREQVESLLNRALAVYEEMPSDTKDRLEIAIVLHGPDAQYFAKKNYEENKNLIDLATKLDEVGFIDMKVCARSAALQGIENDGFPPFIEIVPYGPEAIENLKEAGFTEI